MSFTNWCVFAITGFWWCSFFCKGIKTQKEFDKISYTCTIANLEKFFFLTCFPKIFYETCIFFFFKEKKIVNPTPYLLQDVDNFTRWKSSLKNNYQTFHFWIYFYPILKEIKQHYMINLYNSTLFKRIFCFPFLLHVIHAPQST